MAGNEQLDKTALVMVGLSFSLSWDMVAVSQWGCCDNELQLHQLL